MVIKDLKYYIHPYSDEDRKNRCRGIKSDIFSYTNDLIDTIATKNKEMLFSRMGYFERGTKKKYFFYILKLRYSNKNLAEIAIPHFDNRDLSFKHKFHLKKQFREKLQQLIFIDFKEYFCPKIKRKVFLTENVNKSLLFFSYRYFNRIQILW